MADFPDLILLYGSRPRDSDGFQVARTVSGKPKIRSYYTSTVRQFFLEFQIDDAEKTVLEDFYTANKKLIFNYLYKADNVTYTCMFTKAIQYTPIEGGLWRAEVDIEVIT